MAQQLPLDQKAALPTTPPILRETQRLGPLLEERAKESSASTEEKGAKGKPDTPPDDSPA